MKVKDGVRERTLELITEGVGNCFRRPRVDRERDNTTEASIAYTAFSVGLPITVDVLKAGADCAFKAMGEQPEPDKWADGLIWVGRQLAKNGETDAIRAILGALDQSPVRDEETERTTTILEQAIAVENE